MKFSFSLCLASAIRPYCKSTVPRIIRNPSLLLYAVICEIFNFYIGPDAILPNSTFFPHGLSGIFISNTAVIGACCTIYQGVTIGSASSRKKNAAGSPVVGSYCLFGASSVCVGPIAIGSHVVIGANAVVSSDVPDRFLVVSPPPRLISLEL